MYNVLCSFSLYTTEIHVLCHASSRELRCNTCIIDYNTLVLNMYFIKASQIFVGNIILTELHWIIQLKYWTGIYRELLNFDFLNSGSFGLTKLN